MDWWSERAEWQGPPNRREWLRPRRPSVPADPGAFGYDPWFDDDDDEGTAGVREPRYPRPQPLSGAGYLPEPEPPVYLTLSDARR